MKNLDQPKNSTKPSPNNQGISLEKPMKVDEAAAKANRDVAELLKVDSKDKSNK